MVKITYFNNTARIDIHRLSNALDSSYKDEMFLMACLRCVDSSIMDRTGFYWKHLNFHYDPIPALDMNIDENVGNILEKMAQEAVNKYSEIYLLWSGGIDSTAMTISFMKTIKTKSQITIICSDNSIAEYPWFYNEFKDEYNFEVLGQDIDLRKYLHTTFSPKNKDDYIVLDGFPADQLFTANKWMIYKYPELATLDWHELLYKDYFTFDVPLLFEPDGVFSLGKGKQRHLLKMLDRHIDDFGITISNSYHFFWWLCFVFSFQRHVNIWLNDTRTMFLNIGGFYTHVNIQKWSMYVHHNDLLLIDKPTDYKMPLKNYIYEYTNDLDYRDNKSKIASLPQSYDWDFSENSDNLKYGVKLVDDEGNFISLTDDIADDKLVETYSKYFNTDLVSFDNFDVFTIAPNRKFEK